MATFSAIRFVKNLNLAEWKTKFSPYHVESVTMSYMYTHGKCPDQHVHARSSIIHPLSFSKLLSLDVKDYNIAQRSWSDYANVHAYLGLICIWHNRFFFLFEVLALFPPSLTGTIYINLYFRSWAGSAGRHSAVGSVSDCRSRGRKFDPSSATKPLWRLIFKLFLRSFSPYHWFMRGCQLLAKVCEQVVVYLLED